MSAGRCRVLMTNFNDFDIDMLLLLAGRRKAECQSIVFIKRESARLQAIEE
jgi:hypothetical protein